MSDWLHASDHHSFVLLQILCALSTCEQHRAIEARMGLEKRKGLRNRTSLLEAAQHYNLLPGTPNRAPGR